MKNKSRKNQNRKNIVCLLYAYMYFINNEEEENAQNEEKK